MNKYRVYRSLFLWFFHKNCTVGRQQWWLRPTWTPDRVALVTNSPTRPTLTTFFFHFIFLIIFFRLCSRDIFSSLTRLSAPFRVDLLLPLLIVCCLIESSTSATSMAHFSCLNRLTSCNWATAAMLVDPIRLVKLWFMQGKIWLELVCNAIEKWKFWCHLLSSPDPRYWPSAYAVALRYNNSMEIDAKFDLHKKSVKCVKYHCIHLSLHEINEIKINIIELLVINIHNWFKSNFNEWITPAGIFVEFDTFQSFSIESN